MLKKLWRFLELLDKIPLFAIAYLLPRMGLGAAVWVICLTFPSCFGRIGLLVSIVLSLFLISIWVSMEREEIIYRRILKRLRKMEEEGSIENLSDKMVGTKEEKKD